MPIDLRAWINPQSYDNSFSHDAIAREAAYFTPVPEPVTADSEWVATEARDYDHAGFDSATIPQSATWPDVTVTAGWALAHTKRLSIALAHRPGTQVPTAAARALATLDRLSNGRTAVHLILGHDTDLARDGANVDRLARYRRAAEYLQVFNKTLTSAEPFDFDGEFFSVHGAFSGVTPIQHPRPRVSTPGESVEAIELGIRYADVLAWQGVSLDTARSRIEDARRRASEIGRPAPLGFWINLNFLVGETDGQARDHLTRLEEAIRRLQAYRSGGASPVRSIREDRFEDAGSDLDDWHDDSLYFGLTKLSRATPTLVGSPETIASAVLRYYDLGVETVSLGGHVTAPHDAELRRRTLDLIHKSAAERDRFVTAPSAKRSERLTRAH